MHGESCSTHGRTWDDVDGIHCPDLAVSHALGAAEEGSSDSCRQRVQASGRAVKRQARTQASGAGAGPTLHLGASAPASALMALSALDSSMKEIVALSSSNPMICRARRGHGRGSREGRKRTKLSWSGRTEESAGRGRPAAAALPVTMEARGMLEHGPILRTRRPSAQAAQEAFVSQLLCCSAQFA
jgi:hypothetical protein